MAETFLISTNKLRENSYVDTNITESVLKTSLILAQETMLKPVIGTMLYEKLCTDARGGALTDIYKVLLEDKVQDVLTYYTIFQIIATKAYTISNSGITKEDKSVEMSEIRSLQKGIKGIYSSYEGTLIEYLDNHTKDFPEFKSDSPDDVDSKESTVVDGIIDWSRLNDKDY